MDIPASKGVFMFQVRGHPAPRLGGVPATSTAQSAASTNSRAARRRPPVRRYDVTQVTAISVPPKGSPNVTGLCHETGPSPGAAVGREHHQMDEAGPGDR